MDQKRIPRPPSAAIRFDGNAARQLDLLDPTESHEVASPGIRVARPRSLRLLQKDIYAEIARRRRRAQIQARHLLEK